MKPSFRSLGYKADAYTRPTQTSTVWAATYTRTGHKGTYEHTADTKEELDTWLADQSDIEVVKIRERGRYA